MLKGWIGLPTGLPTNFGPVINLLLGMNVPVNFQESNYRIDDHSIISKKYAHQTGITTLDILRYDIT